ncbi:MAG: hypothetical protein ACE5NG_04445 [bacterium]
MSPILPGASLRVSGSIPNPIDRQLDRLGRGAFSSRGSDNRGFHTKGISAVGPVPIIRPSRCKTQDGLTAGDFTDTKRMVLMK